MAHNLLNFQCKMCLCVTGSVTPVLSNTCDPWLQTTCQTSSVKRLCVWLGLCYTHAFKHLWPLTTHNLLNFLRATCLFSFCVQGAKALEEFTDSIRVSRLHSFCLSVIAQTNGVHEFFIKQMTSSTATKTLSKIQHVWVKIRKQEEQWYVAS